MAEMYSQILCHIDGQFLGYLNADETERSTLRSKLLGSIRTYLGTVQHNDKFRLQQTITVLRRSVSTRASFSGESASRAWAALAKYAENLLRHPWRKEFREIKLYCGFYKHEIESSLIGAEQMLEAMGYIHENNSTMVLQQPYDPDQITFVLRDAITAEVECMILQQVWEKVVKYDVSWSEILDCREKYVIAPEKLVQYLIFDANRRCHANEYRQPARMSYNPNTHDSYSMSHQHHHMTHQAPLPYHPNYSPMPPNGYACNLIYPAPFLKPQEYYPSNGHMMPHMRMSSCHNGYGGPMDFPTTVPTGNLIDINQSPVHQPHSVMPLHPYLPEPVRTTEFPSSRAKEDGTGSFENWTNTFHRLENKNSEKQLSDRMREMSLNRETKPTTRSENKIRTDGDGASRYRHSRSSIDLEDAMLSKATRLNKITVDHESDAEIYSRPKPQVVQEPKPEPKINHNQTEAYFVQPNSEKLNVAKPETKQADLRPTRHFVTLDVSPKFSEESNKNLDRNDHGKWQCFECTFLNVPSVKICEMCGKSKTLKEIPPQPSGGSECPKCTLVNERGMNFCSACNCDLKDSPTYI